LSSSPQPRIFTLPGNAGTAQIGTNLDISLDDTDAIVEVAREYAIDLTVVGPEGPLCAGVVDAFRDAGLLIFGPTQQGARLEGDKAFAKELMRRAQVPTAEARVFEDYDSARTFVATRDTGLVVKASGLAAGKGVMVCAEPAEALLALEQIMLERRFGDAGRKVIVEEVLSGAEISVHALVGGDTIYVLDTSRDYKRAADGDTGPNTGGMGAISPAPGVEDSTLRQIESQILVPIVDALKGEGIDYSGTLYAGVMLTPAGPKVLEFNCRFGDPETQALVPRMRCDLLDVLTKCAQGRTNEIEIEWKPGYSVCVVIASEGYPGKCRTGDVIRGIDEAAAIEQVRVYHAGTARGTGGTITDGGRVLGITATGPDVKVARSRAYQAAGTVRFSGMWYRRDIGAG